jgi:hypothetical protein
MRKMLCFASPVKEEMHIKIGNHPWSRHNLLPSGIYMQNKDRWTGFHLNLIDERNIWELLIKEKNICEHTDKVLQINQREEYMWTYW